MRKLIILGISLILFSCSTLNPTEKFNEQKYVESISLSIKQIINKKSEETLKEYEYLANEVSNIYNENYMKDNYLKNLEYWCILYLIKNYPNNIQMSSKLKLNLEDIDKQFDRAIIYLRRAINSSNNLDSLLSIEENISLLHEFIMDINEKDHQISNKVNIYLQALSDMYIKMATIYEAGSKLVEARDTYKEACNIYNKVHDYKGSCSKFTELDIAITSQEITANMYKAERAYVNDELEDSYYYLNTAYNLVGKYQNRFLNEKLSIIDSLKKVRYELAEKYYSIATQYYYNRDYYEAYQNYDKANKYYPNYRNSKEMANEMYRYYQREQRAKQNRY